MLSREFERTKAFGSIAMPEVKNFLSLLDSYQDEGLRLSLCTHNASGLCLICTGWEKSNLHKKRGI